jgi:peroxiredoxin
MTIRVGDPIPNATLFRLGEDGLEPFDATDYFKGRKIVLFGLPGAFTPTCSAQHVPGFVKHADTFAARGVDAIACVSVNDVWVMKAWGKDQSAEGSVDMLADGNGELTRAMGLDVDLSARGYGVRSRRYAMVVDDGVVKDMAVEEGASLNVSSAEKMLDKV